MSQDKLDKLISRLRAANEALKLLNSGDLPVIQNFLATARCQFNEINNSKAFWSCEYSDEEFKKQIAASSRAAVVRPAPDNPSHFHIFVEPDAREHVGCYDAHMKAFMAVCYAAIGLDMTALGELVPAIDDTAADSKPS